MVKNIIVNNSTYEIIENYREAFDESDFLSKLGFISAILIVSSDENKSFSESESE